MRLRTLVVATALIASGASAQDQPKPPAPPVFGSDVSLVLLPVFVIDKDGKAEPAHRHGGSAKGGSGSSKHRRSAQVKDDLRRRRTGRARRPPWYVCSTFEFLNLVHKFGPRAPDLRPVALLKI